MEEEFTRERLHLYSAGVLSYSDVAPFLDELNRQHMFVEATVSNQEEAAFGVDDVALTLLVANTSVPYLKAFFSTWEEEDARQLRAEFLKLLDRAQRNRFGRKYSPMTVSFSRLMEESIDGNSHPTRVRFRFHRALAEDELLTQLRGAQEYMESLPDNAFEGSGGLSENCLFWDGESQSWRGDVTGFREDDRYIPPDLCE